jgi:hypothetical protein
VRASRSPFPRAGGEQAHEGQGSARLLTPLPRDDWSRKMKQASVSSIDSFVRRATHRAAGVCCQPQTGRPRKSSAAKLLTEDGDRHIAAYIAMLPEAAGRKDDGVVDGPVPPLR